ncbi:MULTISPECIES: hypothetical protein [Chryseobacterium]|jgi:hypothetical protein|uniref:Uncharacterized protein n=3 Tax=Chryseobacterium TaxID=59732 RepID=A0A3D9ATG3_9FLAO|nr:MULTISPECIES: hypothetical protein [Chryseobacterium]HAO06427.1 hypothetical protein [Chryseobacterium sp.]MBL7882062.1 hypothetical protein [Chryseobacterium gambrini]OVE58724.1 hypothetical protein B0E34_06855 [Chryseobacterium mucoviscidosis]PVV56433.1 hypothetical protein DD829_11100 [Chryseobacterium sp. HMWF035]REC44583.1 hypothetical protein DRF68_16345 [Candidatus Chryseobacterium massiliae]
MKKMFTLRGVSKTGKTTKVKLIAEWISNNYLNKEFDLKKGDICTVFEVDNLYIAFVSAGDDINQVKKINNLLKEYENIDIVINACRTRGAGRKYLEGNFNKEKGWLVKNIFVKKLGKEMIEEQEIRDSKILEELKTWLTGVKKLEK